MRIAYDIDNVLADHQSAITKAARDRYGIVNSETIYQTQSSLLEAMDTDFWFNLKPLPLVTALNFHGKSRGVEIFIISRRPPWLTEVTTAWLNRYVESFDPHVICGVGEKGYIAKAMYIKSFYEDDPIQAMQIARVSPETMVYLVNHPHTNAWFTVPKELKTKIWRVHND